MQLHELSPLVEALLFVADRPLTLNNLVKAVDDRSATATEIKRVLDALIENYDTQPRGFKLVRLGSGYQIVTRERFAPWVEGLIAGKRRARLTRAALETAAVIAYKQPITRLDIERIRGVDVGGVLHTLLERNLVMIKGRDPGPGRPLLYGTTQPFLEYFGLGKLSDLPRLDEIAALAKAETAGIWADEELVRFERHGVERESVPPPGVLLEEIPEPEIPPETDEDGATAQIQDREEFQSVVTELAEESSPEEPEPAAGPESSESVQP